MESSSSLKQSEDQLIEAADKLMPQFSADELVNQLDKLEKLLSMVPQEPCSSMRNALAPATSALISDQLFRHADINVRVSVLSCITELSRISAPDSPYHDGKMKEVFKLTVKAFEKLSDMSGHCYKKAVQMLNIVSKVRSSLLMQDLECDDLIVRMFNLFLDIVRYDHPSDVFLNMVSIMTLVIEESDEISFQLLSPILTSVEKENQKVSRILGERVLKNCAAVLKAHLPQIVQFKGIDLNEYSEIVHFICRGDSSKEQKIAEEVEPAAEPAPEPAAESAPELAAEPAPEMAPNPAADLAQEPGPEPDVISMEEPVSSVNEHIKAVKINGCNSSKKKKQNVLPETDFEKKKRERRPNHRLNSEEGYDDFWFQNTRKITSPRNFVVKKDDGHRSDSQVKQESLVRTDNKENQKAGEVCDKSVTKESGDKELVSPAVNRDGTSLNEPSKRKHKRKWTPARKQDSVIVCGIKDYGQELVGHKIKVWWPLDKVFYDGCITSFDPSEKKHTVLYVDDEQEVLDLNLERWELVRGVSSHEESNNSKTPAASQKLRSKKFKTKSDSSAKRSKIKPSNSKSASFSTPDSVIVINDDDDDGILEGNSHKNASGELVSRENFSESKINKIANRMEA